MVVKVRISAPEREDAEELSDHLTDKQIVAGTLITSGDSRYHWEGEIVEKEYFNIQAYTLQENKEELIEEVEDIQPDEAPIIEFIQIDGNQKFLDWVKESVE